MMDLFGEGASILQQVNSAWSKLGSQMSHRAPGLTPADQSEAAASLLGKESHSDAGVQSQQQNLLSIHFWRVVVLVVGVSIGVVLQSYTTVLSFNHSWKLAQVMGNEAIYTDPPIRLQTYPFARAGFHRNDSELRNHLTEFEGRPNKKNNAAWDHILSVGVIAISDEENARLPSGGSAAVRQHPDQHIVLLAMFHQLHCLKYLRNLIYDFDAGKIRANDGDEYRVMHGDHCIDYLRQSLMCHGDITPILQDWHPDFNAYSARQETVHQCRDFDEIWRWAEQRNTTGLRADGHHDKHQVE